MGENTLAAAEAAIEHGFAVEVDLRLTADGGLIVTHDAMLERTTHAQGRVMERTLDELRRIVVRGSDETLSSLDDLLALAGGRSALFLELKAPYDHAAKAAMTAALTRSLSRYGGAVAAMSFDPDLIALLRRALPDTPLGILAGGEGHQASMVSRFGRDAMLHTPRTKPDFIAYYATALPTPLVALRRRKRPLFAWTVRSHAEAQRLKPHVDQIIFEGFLP